MQFAPTKTLFKRWVLPLASGGLLAAAYPPFAAGQVAWVALIPLLFALADCQPGEAFRRGFIAGLAFFGATVWWTIHVTLAGTIGLIAFLALYFGVAAVWLAFLLRWGGSVRRGSVDRAVPTDQPVSVPEPGDLRSAGSARSGDRRTTEPGDRRTTEPGDRRTTEPGDRRSTADSVGRNLVVAVLASAGWVTLEWVRGWFLFGGFGWNLLGVSQHAEVPLIQISSVTGVYGVSALVCFLNAAFYFTVRRFARPGGDRGTGWRLSWELYGAIILVCASFLYGLRTITRGAAPRPDMNLRLALVQGNIPQTLKFVPGEKSMIIARYRRLTKLAAAARPDLIIWPETTVPEPLRYDPESYGLATNLAARAGAGLLTGTVDYTPQAKPAEAFNAAALVRPDGFISTIYRKIHLVPFGEFVPLHRICPVLKWLTPIQDSFERGREFTVFQLEEWKGGRVEAGKNGRMEEWKDGETLPVQPSNLPTFHPSFSPRFGVVICFEDTVPDLYRRFVARGVDFMVNITNDAWFQTSPAAALHLANAVFRAAETHRPLVRATNNGVTCIVDRFGFVRARLEPFTEGSLNYELPLPGERETTFYTEHGDVFVGACAAVTAVAIGWLLIRRRQEPASLDTATQLHQSLPR